MKSANLTAIAPAKRQVSYFDIKTWMLFVLAASPAVVSAILLWNRSEQQQVIRLLAVLLCVASLAMTFSLRLLVQGSLMTNIRKMSSTIRATAQGDLTVAAVVSSDDEIGQMSRQLDSMSGNLSIMVANIRNNADVVAKTGNDLADTSSELSRRTAQQAAAIEETSATITEITATVNQNADTVMKLDKLASKVRGTAESGERAMRTAVDTINGIQESSRRVSEIVAVIDGIAFQTNILALNAAVEAARAGEQGRSFAVVASEVSTLAQRSAQAAKEIKTLIHSSSDQIGQGVARVNDVAQTLQSIVTGVQQFATQVSDISGATSEQSRSLGQVAQAMAELDSITQHNAELVEQSTSVAQVLDERATRMSHSVQHFRLRQGTANEAMALVQRALDHYQQYGLQATISAVNDPSQRFFDRDMYVFIGADDSEFLACAGRPERVGVKVFAAPGTPARKIHDDIWDQVRKGGGWVEYEIKNPLTGVVEPKMSYVMPLEHLMVACGVYRTELMADEQVSRGQKAEKRSDSDNEIRQRAM
jgi:methyl-accepting chemotaxis protein